MRWYLHTKGWCLKLVYQLTYQVNSVSSTEKDINTRLIESLSVIWKSDLADKLKRSFFPSSGHIDSAICMHHMDANKLSGGKAWLQLHKNDVGNIEQVLEATPHKTAPPITKTVKVRRTRHAGDSWRSTDKLISDILLWTPSHWRVKAGRPARTYIQ